MTPRQGASIQVSHEFKQKGSNKKLHTNLIDTDKIVCFAISVFKPHKAHLFMTAFYGITIVEYPASIFIHVCNWCGYRNVNLQHLHTWGDLVCVFFTIKGQKSQRL